jgi:DNA-directed RNA polymerase subunit H
MALSVSKHMLVPEHKKLTKEEKEALLSMYNITTKELPRILKDDPALAGLAVDSGDVIKITRESPTAGKSVYYRVVIRG